MRNAAGSVGFVVGACLLGACLWIACIVGACASRRAGEEPFQPEITDPTRAVVYVFRDAPVKGGRAVRVFINQQPAGELWPGEYLARTVAAGETVVRVEADASAASPVTLRAGEAAYMRVVVMPGLGPARPSLEVPDSESARPLIARMTRAAP